MISVITIVFVNATPFVHMSSMFEMKPFWGTNVNLYIFTLLYGSSAFRTHYRIEFKPQGLRIWPDHCTHLRKAVGYALTYPGYII